MSCLLVILGVTRVGLELPATVKVSSSSWVTVMLLKRIKLVSLMAGWVRGRLVNVPPALYMGTFAIASIVAKSFVERA